MGSLSLKGVYILDFLSKVEFSLNLTKIAR